MIDDSDGSPIEHNEDQTEDQNIVQPIQDSELINQ